MQEKDHCVHEGKVAVLYPASRLKELLPSGPDGNSRIPVLISLAVFRFIGACSALSVTATQTTTSLSGVSVTCCAVNQLLKSVVPEIGTLRCVGAGSGRLLPATQSAGEQSPVATRRKIQPEIHDTTAARLSNTFGIH